MIQVDGLYRFYEERKGFFKRTVETKKAVNGITFRVEKGEIFGLLGPNGAGKTSTIKVLTTLLLPTKGSVKIFGLDILQHKREIRKKINFIYGGEKSLYGRLTARDNLLYFCDLYEVEEGIMRDRVDFLLHMVGLENYGLKKVETFSKGMKQRLQIARALVNDPEIIFMDEPTIGLDPSASRLLHEIILKMKAEGKTIVITTHYMKEAENLCDRIGFIRNGEMIDVCSPSEHKRRAASTFGKEMTDLEEVYLAYFGDQRSVS